MVGESLSGYLSDSLIDFTMSRPAMHIVAYEHQRVRVTSDQQRRLLQLQEQHRASWFTAGYQSLQLSSYVGVIQLPGLTLEILPKADDPGRTANMTLRWRQVLLQMLQSVYELPVAVPNAAQLADAPHAMLDLFIAAFVKAADKLLQQGLVKRYRTNESNRTALKGQLLFAQQLRVNLVHGERFFTRSQVYDVFHPLNSLLRMALVVAADVAHGAALAARARTLLLHWPELPTVSIPESMPVLGRKTVPYRPALELALLLLRQHSPALRGGSTEAVALLFDMNRLFEGYVTKQLRKAAGTKATVKAQNQQHFWGAVKVRPDIVVTVGERSYVLDTKWKIPKNNRPAAADLQQLYAYCHLWKAQQGLLVYPNADGKKAHQGQDYQASQLMPSLPIHGTVYFAGILSDSQGINKEFGQQLLKHFLDLP
ncbi:hypothetical protein FNT36_22160 [Hymenobacter setariae]|uniref:Restriction endonuclease n=1 Tax=Hymenobacter setariae TaxID=2594794 RepID=A0A558BMY3_9BACT|nr:hypothetical protein [Hymenobacter setariae]TVT37866.1 hypothetical protein FNT36_22160 [Hymenobacter setariae]